MTDLLDELPPQDAALVFHVDGSLSIVVPRGSDDLPGGGKMSAGSLAVTELLFRLTEGDLTIAELVASFERRIDEAQ